MRFDSLAAWINRLFLLFLSTLSQFNDFDHHHPPFLATRKGQQKCDMSAGRALICVCGVSGTRGSVRESAWQRPAPASPSPSLPPRWHCASQGLWVPSWPPQDPLLYLQLPTWRHSRQQKALTEETLTPEKMNLTAESCWAQCCTSLLKTYEHWHQYVFQFCTN